MQVIEALERKDKLVLSLEITPPDKGRSIEELFATLDLLMPFNPAFVSVTYHQAQVVYEEKDGVIYRIPKRKKPGTVGISAAIAHRYQVDMIPHFICGGFSKFDTEDALIDLHYLGITNILALRGDFPLGQKMFIPEKDGHRYAAELVQQIARMNQGQYLEALEDAQCTNFCIGVAGYPEKHFEAVNFEKDLEHLKEKVDQGAHYIITQMFFDFTVFKKFVERAREMGITVPIIPGIKPITRIRQIETLPRDFHISIPHHIVSAMEEAKTREEARKIGIKKTVELCRQLIDFGVPGLHIYTMGKGGATQALLQGLFG